MWLVEPSPRPAASRLVVAQCQTVSVAHWLNTRLWQWLSATGLMLIVWPDIGVKPAAAKGSLNSSKKSVFRNFHIGTVPFGGKSGCYMVCNNCKLVLTLKLVSINSCGLLMASGSLWVTVANCG